MVTPVTTGTVTRAVTSRASMHVTVMVAVVMWVHIRSAPQQVHHRLALQLAKVTTVTTGMVTRAVSSRMTTDATVMIAIVLMMWVHIRSASKQQVQ
jgi:hypothetical protein